MNFSQMRDLPALTDTTAGNSETKAVGVPAGGSASYQIVGAVFLPDTNRTANDTNYAILKIYADSTEVASIDTRTAASGGTGNLVALTPVQFSIASKAVKLTAGTSIVKAIKTVAASGVALTGAVSVIIEPIR